MHLKNKKIRWFTVTVNGMIHQLPATSPAAALKQAERLERALLNQKAVRGKKEEVKDDK